MSHILRILVVEDNPGDAELIREMLPETGQLSFHTEWVSSLAAALTRLERAGLDIVLLDLSLPDSHGLATFHKLRQTVPGVPIIVLTGTDDDELAVAAVREGAQDYLVKGQISPSLMGRAIRYAVERQKLTEALRQARATAEAALAQVKTLAGLIPICAGCKKIRDDHGYWSQVESYLSKHTDVEFTHGLCPECIKHYYPQPEDAGPADSPKGTS